MARLTVGETTADRAQTVDYRVLLPLCLTVFAAALNVMGITPFFRDIADDLDSSVALIGQSTTITMLTAGVVGLVIGPIADQYGHRRTLLFGAVAIMLSALGTILAPTFLPLMGARLLGGFGTSMTIGVSLGAVAARFAGRARLRAMSLIGASLATATAVGPVLLTSIGTLIGWRGAFAFVMVISLLAFGMILTLVPVHRRERAGRMTVGEVLASYAPLLGDRSMLTLYLVWTLRAFCWLGPLSYLGAYVIDEHGLSTGGAGFVYMGAGFGYMAGSLTTGGKLGNFDLRALSVIALGGMGIGWLLLYVVPGIFAASMGFLAIATVLAGISQISVTTLMAEETQAGPSTTMVLNETVLSFGASLGSLTGGVLLGLGGYTLLGFGLPVSAFLAMVLVAHQRRRARIASQRTL